MTSIDAIINRQLLRWELERKEAAENQHEPPQPAPIVTVSRQTGSRGSYFASRLAQKLQYQRLHREVIDAICKDSGYRKRIVESLDEHLHGELQTLVDALFTGQAVDHSDYNRHLVKVILSMSSLGGVIVMGRAANFILGSHRGFHIRVVCPREKRIENLIKYKNFTEKDAAGDIDKSDRTRREFVRKLFDADIDSPLHYDLVINSSLMDVEDMVVTVALAMGAKMSKLRFLDHDQI